MAWFKKDATPTPPVTVDRVLATLESMGYKLEKDPERDAIGATFNEIPMVFELTTGYFLRLHAMPNIEVTAQNYNELMQFSHNWNADSLWGTAYIEEDDDGELDFYVDVSTPVGEGLSDEQLESVLDLSLTVSIDCVDHYLGNKDKED